MALLGADEIESEPRDHRASAGALLLAEFLLETRARLENLQKLLSSPE